MGKLGKFYIHDKAKTQSAELANFRPHFNERYAIVNRETGKIVDEANTQYQARQALAEAKATDGKGYGSLSD